MDLAVGGSEKVHLIFTSELSNETHVRDYPEVHLTVPQKKISLLMGQKFLNLQCLDDYKLRTRPASCHIWHLIFLYIKLELCVRMLTYSLRRDIPVCSKLGMLMSWNQKEILGRIKLDDALCLSPGEHRFCSLEMKQNTMIVTIPKLLVRWGNFRIKDHNPEKSALYSHPDDNNVCTWETSNDNKSCN